MFTLPFEWPAPGALDWSTDGIPLPALNGRAWETGTRAAWFLAVVQILLRRYSPAQAVTVVADGRPVTAELSAADTISSVVRRAADELDSGTMSGPVDSSVHVVTSPAGRSPRSQLAGGAHCLVLKLDTQGEKMQVDVAYRPQRVTQEQVRRLGGHLGRLAAAAVVDPDQSLRDLPVLCPEEESRILSDWTATGRGYPRHELVHRIVTRQAHLRPEAPALTAGDVTHTYGELEDRALVWAAACAKPVYEPVTSGVEAFARDLAGQLTQRSRGLWNLYGPTETTIYSLGTSIDVGDFITIGTPLDNECAYLLDADLNALPVGVLGELYVAGDGLAHGYLGRPDLNSLLATRAAAILTEIFSIRVPVRVLFDHPTVPAQAAYLRTHGFVGGIDAESTAARLFELAEAELHGTQSAAAGGRNAGDREENRCA